MIFSGVPISWSGLAPPASAPIVRQLAAGVLVSGIITLLPGCTTTLNRAITRDQPKAVDKYLDSGANVNAPDKSGATPLINAGQFGELALMQRLVERGANVNASDKLGNSALTYVVSGESYKNAAVAYLLAHGASINHTNYRSQTPLLLASMRACEPGSAGDQAELLTILLKAGANPNEMGPTGELPLHLAAFAGQPDGAIDVLIHATKDPHAASSSGCNAFMEAARGDHRETGLHLAASGFEPSLLTPGTARTSEYVPSLDESFPANARAQYFYGDFLASNGRKADALASYLGSSASFNEAIAEYRKAVDTTTALLKKEKSARRSRIASIIAVDTLGVGLAAVTGVGFFAVPKRAVNNIDEYEDELETDSAVLGALLKEQADLEDKIRAAQSTAPAPAATGS